MTAPVLVTGASGFVGGAVVAALAAEGVPVRAMVRDPDWPAPAGAEVVVADLRDVESVRRAATGARAVVHAAAFLGEFGDPAIYQDVNVAGTQRLLDAAKDAGVRRFVFISSPSALMSSSGADQVDIDESVPYPDEFLNSYCATKAASERLVLAADTEGFSTCALRPRAIWGPGDRRGPIVQILGKIKTGRLPDLSGGRDIRASLCYIDNLVAAIRDALETDIGGRAYFVADEEPVSLWPTLSMVATRFGLQPPTRRVSPGRIDKALKVIEAIWRVPAIGNRWPPPLSRYAVALVTRTATYDTTRAREELGYRPTVDFDEGLERFEAWVNDIGGLDVLLEGAS